MIKDLMKPLKADDIEVRIGHTSENKGFSLLLYKTARTDIERLNEVLMDTWKNSYRYDDKNNLVCTISVLSAGTNTWVSREDVGTESNTEKEKGSYSDAFKKPVQNGV